VVLTASEAALACGRGERTKLVWVGLGDAEGPWCRTSPFDSLARGSWDLWARELLPVSTWNRVRSVT
jgi:hypothetical protein